MAWRGGRCPTCPHDKQRVVRPECSEGREVPTDHALRPSGRATRHASQASSAIRLTTGAALANGGKPMPPVDPDVFCQGMVVLHAAYGLGEIIALSGSGAARKATVAFQPPEGHKKVLLAEGSLRPVGV